MAQPKATFSVLKVILTVILLCAILGTITVVPRNLGRIAWFRDAATALFAVILAMLSVIYYLSDLEQSRARTEKIAQIEAKAEQEPDKTKFAWDLARENLKHTLTEICRRSE